MSSITDEATYRLYATGWALVKRLPERTAYRLFEQIADRMWRKQGRSVLQLERNLARVLGPEATPERVREVSRQSLRNYLRYWCETFRLETWDTDRRATDFHPENTEYLKELIASGRGVVMALPHMANWDSAGAWLTTFQPGFTTVAERLKPEKLFQRFLDFRESLGFEVLPLTGGSRTLLKLAKRLRTGGVVCLVADRDLTASGIPVDFFGETATFPSGAASLALSTGAALVPVALWFEDKGQTATFYPEVVAPTEGTREEKVAAMTRAVAAAFEYGIGQHPADWHMLQRFWLADLPPREPVHQPGRPEEGKAAAPAAGSAGPAASAAPADSAVLTASAGPVSSADSAGSAVPVPVPEPASPPPATIDPAADPSVDPSIDPAADPTIEPPADPALDPTLGAA